MTRPNQSGEASSGASLLKIPIGIQSAFRPSPERMKDIALQCEEKLLKAREEDLNEFSEK